MPAWYAALLLALRPSTRPPPDLDAVVELVLARLDQAKAPPLPPLPVVCLGECYAPTALELEVAGIAEQAGCPVYLLRASGGQARAAYVISDDRDRDTRPS